MSGGFLLHATCSEAGAGFAMTGRDVARRKTTITRVIMINVKGMSLGGCGDPDASLASTLLCEKRSMSLPVIQFNDVLIIRQLWQSTGGVI